LIQQGIETDTEISPSTTTKNTNYEKTLIENNSEEGRDLMVKTLPNSSKPHPLYCGFAVDPESLEKISDFIAATSWDGALTAAR
jgi:hypothetical protein